jgi:hypothetical protein
MGYFQLLNAVDCFVIYDDVSFIKQGWINRNKILIDGKEHLFTIPLKHVSSFETIKNTLINERLYCKWREKFLRTLKFNYKKAPYFKNAYSIIEEVFSSESEYISRLAVNSLKAVSNYLGIKSCIVESSTQYQNSHLCGQERIIDICKKEKAKMYLNLIGGVRLYSRSDFDKQHLTLSFIASPYLGYRQFENKFVSGLSIIDVLMFNSPGKTNEMLEDYQLS